MTSDSQPAHNTSVPHTQPPQPGIRSSVAKGTCVVSQPLQFWPTRPPTLWPCARRKTRRLMLLGRPLGWRVSSRSPTSVSATQSVSSTQPQTVQHRGVPSRAGARQALPLPGDCTSFPFHLLWYSRRADVFPALWSSQLCCAQKETRVRPFTCSEAPCRIIAMASKFNIKRRLCNIVLFVEYQTSRFCVCCMCD